MLVASLIFLVVLNEPHEFSVLDLWEKRCNEGNARACERLENARGGVEKLQRLDRLAARYGARADREELEGDNMPRLNLAYMQVMRDFIDAEHAAGNRELSYDEEAINYCADHFHNYWRNRKLWWPTDADGAPSWTDIYYYIVDHYHGVCLRRYFNQL